MTIENQNIIFPGVYRHHKRGNLYYAIDVVSLAGGEQYSHILLMAMVTGEFIIYPVDRFNSIETLASGEEVRYFTKVTDISDKEVRKLKRQSVNIFVEEFAEMVHSMKRMSSKITELQKRNSEYHDEICMLKKVLNEKEEELNEILEMK